MIAQDQKEANVAHDEADLLTVREVAIQLRVDDTTVRRWIKNGALEAITCHIVELVKLIVSVAPQ